MAAGKTSIGRRLAKALGEPFVDTDKAIVAAHGPIPEIFAQQGEPHFRAIEREAVREAVADGGVISLGGGAVTDAETRALLRGTPVAYLSLTREAAAARIQGNGRPLLAGDDPLERWTQIYAQRRGWYEEVADATFDTSRRPLQRIAEEIAAWRRELG